MMTVRYMVHNTEEAIAFYIGLLGFELVERWGPAFAIVGKGELRLWLSGPQTSAAKAMPDGRQPQPGGWNRVVVEVDDIEVAVDELTKRGAKFRNIVVSGPGGKQVLVDDPSGNPIELFEPA